MRLLLVEDDPMIGRAMVHGLQQAGFAIDWVTDGSHGLTAVQSHVYDLVVLDLGLPRLDGLALLRALRAGRDDVAVLIVSARDAVATRVEGLNAGADDYLLKPFDLDELIARVRALLRRRAGTLGGQLVAGLLRLDPVRRTVLNGEREVALTAKEFALLEALMRRPGEAVSRFDLLECAWDDSYDNRSNVVDVYIGYLRQKVDRPFGTESIETVRGFGYRLRTEETE